MDASAATLRDLSVGLVVTLLCLLLAPSAFAAPLGNNGFAGGLGTEGGKFAVSPVGGTVTPGTNSSPAGIAVNDTTGAVYVADGANERVQRFDSEGDFEWAIGFDVIQ